MNNVSYEWKSLSPKCTRKGTYMDVKDSGYGWIWMAMEMDADKYVWIWMLDSIVPCGR